MNLNWDFITQSTLLVDKSKALRNIHRMKEKAKQAHVQLRPHFKTHQSSLIGSWFGPPNETPIAVSSLSMAEYFALSGWTDIHLAIPFNPREMKHINDLASYTTLSLTIEHPSQLPILKSIEHPFHAFVEVDTGYQRTGIDAEQVQQIQILLAELHAIPQVQSVGLMLHNGLTYQAQGKAEIVAAHQASSQALTALLEKLNWPAKLKIATGDTPACSIVDAFPSATEIRPGNYVFYDLQQKLIGACDWDDIAAAVACPVIAIYPERSEVVVHTGAVHLSKDYADTPQGRSYGQVMRRTEQGWGQPIEGGFISRLSQEHGVVTLPAHELEQIKRGDLLVVVPAHSCLTMAAMQDFIWFESP